MVVSDALAHRIAERVLAYVEVPVDRAEWERRAAFDVERSLLVVDVIRGAARTDSILEVGVGWLGLATVLRDQFPNARIVASEHPDRRYLADERFRADAADLRVDVRPWDVADDPPFDLGSFDVVVFSEILEHLPPNIVPAVLDRLRELLAPDGRIVMSSPNLSAFYRLASLAFGSGHVMDTPSDVEQHPGVYGHLRIYNRDDVDRLAGQAGLRLVDWRWSDWEIGMIATPGWRGNLLRAGQGVASRIVPRWSCAWVCALVS